MSNVCIGAINWDCSIPSTEFFGFHSTKSLSPFKYRKITPFYADVLGENKIDYHKRSLEEYEIELQYAIDIGIDYFAYCWYTENKNPQNVEKDWQVHLHQLSYARKMHSKSKLKDKIKMCAIVGVGKGTFELTDAEILELAEEMKNDYYQKISGKPLVYVYTRYDTELIEKIKKACVKCGAPKPYIAFMCPRLFDMNSRDCYPEIDAVSGYGFVAYAKSYEEYFDKLLEEQEINKKFGVKIIPRFSINWNPTPRIDNPVPWVEYKNTSYVSCVTHDQLIKSGKQFADWISNNKDIADTGHILIFAWNEFEEGGWICPTYDENLKIDTERADTFNELIKHWKKEL